MKVVLLSRSDVERVITDSYGRRQGNTLLLCTIVESLQIAEQVRKGRSRMHWRAFLRGWESSRETPNLYVAPLDADCLERALFERADMYTVVGLWSGIGSRTLPIERTMRRLILRPSEQTWWGDELYDEMETWYE